MTTDSPDGRALRFAHRRPEILRAIVDHVLEHGAGFSLRDAAAAAGISHATLLHHFGSREALLAEAIAAARTRADPPTPPASLAHAIEQEWQFWSDPRHTQLFALQFEVYAAALRQSVPTDVMTALTTQPLTEFVALALRTGCPPSAAEPLATRTFAEFRGLLLDLFSTQDTKRVQGAVDDLARHLREIEDSWR